jgi:uncharacterized protein (UPF0548 family)
MISQTKAIKIELFGNARHDARYLQLWRTVPVSYMPGQPPGRGWHIDNYQESLTHDETGQVFSRATDLLMRYQFYPASIMQATSDFGEEQRWLRAGDRIVQRVHLLSIVGLSIFELLTVNQVASVIDEPKHKGFTCITTQGHSEKGEWSASVEWSATHDLILHVKAISKSNWSLPWPAGVIVRWFQLRAHKLGIESFKQRVLMEAS